MFKHKFHFQPRIDCPGIFRKLLLAWLVAITVEYILLPKDLRNLAEIEGLAQMSVIRVGCIALGMMILLLCLSRLDSCARIERIGIAVTFAGLAITTLIAHIITLFFVISSPTSGDAIVNSIEPINLVTTRSISL